MANSQKLIERLEAVAESIDDDSHIHPLCAKKDVLEAVERLRQMEVGSDE